MSNIVNYFKEEIPSKLTNRVNGRNKGNTYERTICKELRDLGFEADTSRNESRKMDALKVDIISNTPYHIQCKAVERFGGYHDLIKQMPLDKTPVIFHKRNNKGTVVIMKKEDFYNILKNNVCSK